MPDLVPADRYRAHPSRRSVADADGRSRRRVIAGVLAVVVATTLHLHAQTYNPSLTFDAALTVALRRNADLESLGRQQAIWDLLHARTAPSPHVDAHADHGCAPTCASGSIAMDICVTPPIRDTFAPMGGAFMSQDVVSVAQMVRRNLREAFYDLVLSDAEVQEIQNVIDFTSEFRTVATSDAKVTDRSRLDELRVEIALSEGSIQLIQAQSRRGLAQAAFNTVLDRAPDAPVTVVGDLMDPIRLPQLDPAIRLSKAMDVALRQLRHDVDIQRRTQVASMRPRRSRLPRPSTNGAARRSAAGTDDAPSSDRRRDTAVEEQIVQLDAARVARERVLEHCMREGFAEVDRRRRASAHYEAALMPAAAAIVTRTTDDYRAGRADVTDVLQAQRTLADLRRSYLQSLHALRLSEADVERRLPAMGLTV